MLVMQNEEVECTQSPFQVDTCTIQHLGPFRYSFRAMKVIQNRIRIVSK
jgi:hypothetical protein